MKKEIKDPETSVKTYCVKTMETYSVSYKKYTLNENSSVKKTKKID